MQKENLSKLYKPLIYVFIFCIYYVLFLNQALMRPGPLGNFSSDISSHIVRDNINAISANYYLHENWLKLLTLDYEPFLHMMTALAAILIHMVSQNTERMDLANAIALILSLAKLSEFIIIKKILDSTVKLNEAESIFITVIINFCSVLYLPFINLNIYFPMLSPNVLHNPTTILLTPLAIMFFYWYIKIYINSDTATYKRTILFSVLLIITTLVKPAFTNVMLIVIAIYYLFHLKRFISKYLCHDLLIFIPSAILILYQIYIISKSNFGNLAFAPYKVIGYYTQHPIITLLQAIEFPLLITCISSITNISKLNNYLYFSWLFAFIAYLIWSLFYLTGPTWTHGNLAWSYSLSLTLLYIFSIITYVRVLVNNDVCENGFVVKIATKLLKYKNKDQIYNFIVNLGAVNLGFIFLSGLNQFIKVYLGGSWL